MGCCCCVEKEILEPQPQKWTQYPHPDPVPDHEKSIDRIISDVETDEKKIDMMFRQILFNISS